ncbi:hypothetical protein ACHAXN_011821 [Cyclotella atomus]
MSSCTTLQRYAIESIRKFCLAYETEMATASIGKLPLVEDDQDSGVATLLSKIEKLQQKKWGMGLKDGR